MHNIALLPSVTAWLAAERAIESAVLFGSTARAEWQRDAATQPFDVDLHVIARQPAALESVDWRAALPDAHYCFHAVRPATGGVRKVTAIFASGQIDLVIVPIAMARLARLLLYSRLYRQFRFASIALNEMATCLHPGYRFLKGEGRWGRLYSRVHAEMPGVRLTDEEIQRMADAFLADFLWVLRKIECGELVAAQHWLHRHLSETNLRLFRELRLRRGLPLPSFGLGRRVERLASSAELERLRVDAGLDCEQLTCAAYKALGALETLMAEMVTSWRSPEGMNITASAAVRRAASVNSSRA